MNSLTMVSGQNTASSLRATRSGELVFAADLIPRRLSTAFRRLVCVVTDLAEWAWFCGERQFAATAIVIGCLLAVTAPAHEGPEHEIDELTARIKIEGESADLLLQRGIEYNVLNK